MHRSGDMKKGIIISLLIVLIIFLLSSCKQTPPPNSPTLSSPVHFEALSLLKAEHSELDFGVSPHDGIRTIRDFAIRENGNLLLLELSNKVHEYSPSGEWLGSYDYDFAGKGLTAYMLTCDKEENLYFIDGHNSLIIKANRNEILATSSFGEKSIITEPGLIKSMTALKENILLLTAISPHDYLTYTYELDVSKDDALCISQPREGIVLGKGLSYKNELITQGEYGELTDGTLVTIYKNGIEKAKFEIHRANNFIFGLQIYGVNENGDYLAKIFEYLADGNSLQETLVILDNQGEIKSICQDQLKEDDIIRIYNGNSYVLRFNTDGIDVFPLQKLFATSQGGD